MFMFHVGLFDAIAQGRGASIKFYNEWIEEVKRTVPPERLLVFDINEGWKPLCNFLDVSMPDCPFPYIDDTSQLQTSQRNLKMISYLTVFALPIIASLLMAFFYRYKVFDH